MTPTTSYSASLKTPPLISYLFLLKPLTSYLDFSDMSKTASQLASAALLITMVLLSTSPSVSSNHLSNTLNSIYTYDPNNILISDSTDNVLMSNNGLFRMVLTNDGILVVETPAGPMWFSSRNPVQGPCFAQLQVCRKPASLIDFEAVNHY